MVISGEDVCCSVVFGTLVGVFVFSVMWSKLLMTYAITCPLWSSVYEYHNVECAFTSPVRTEPTSCIVQPIVAHCCEVMYFWCFDFRGEIGFLNCNDI